VGSATRPGFDSVPGPPFRVPMARGAAARAVLAAESSK